MSLINPKIYVKIYELVDKSYLIVKDNKPIESTSQITNSVNAAVALSLGEAIEIGNRMRLGYTKEVISYANDNTTDL